MKRMVKQNILNCLFKFEVITIILLQKSQPRLAPIEIEMLNQKHIQKSLQCLIGGNTDLVVYGHKSWGRTSLIKNILDKSKGKGNYLYVNSVLVWDRNSFLYVVNSQFCRVTRCFDWETKLTKSLENKLMKNEDFFQTLDQWVKMVNSFTQQEPNIFAKIKRMYIFVDNMEEIAISDNFFLFFYKACKHQIEHFKFSFIFSGSHLKGRSLSNQDPFRRIISLFIPRPDLKEKIAEEVEKTKNWVDGIPELNKLKESLISHLYLKFQILQNDYERVGQISQLLMKQCIDSFQGKFELVNGFLRMEGLQSLSKPMIESEVPSLHRSRKDNDEISLQSVVASMKVCEKKGMKIQKYPLLILTSIFLANGYSEHDDRRRFAEYRRRKAKVVKNRKITLSGNEFQKNETLTRHPIHRINAISESLEDQADRFLPESALVHHSLDQYGCFQYLQEEAKLEYIGKGSKNHWGKLAGESREEEAREFLRWANLKMSQFTDLED